MDQLQVTDVYHVPESSLILNIILHAIYKTSCANNAPTIEQLIEAIDKMPIYGLEPKSVICSKDPLYHLLLSHGAIRPVKVYALAAHHSIEELAKHISTYLLSHSVKEIDDQTAERIGAIYLKRFLVLCLSRPREIAEILIQPPERHPPNDACGYEEQKSVTREWSLSLVDIVLGMRPGVYLRGLINDFADAALRWKTFQSIVFRALLSRWLGGFHVKIVKRR
ncbi:hypothetical protein EST38_g3689 [Candolleomyces aberdarensis]|uniref:Uncharacterized protein n=1 Tax=Candolleomyces aberdarensis TaxID=2316362 RepID=A0A4Q2DPZ7_9AGAR|nr:hypothetical protein EST38_g3689 [Candolleomyces aberdarensis]